MAIGAHLVNGIPLTTLGSPIDNPVRVAQPKPVQIGNGWEAEVIWVDSFGNLSTNLKTVQLPEDKGSIEISIGDARIEGVRDAFGEAEPGSLIAILDSCGSLAISVVNGNAAERLNAGLGTDVFVQTR